MKLSFFKYHGAGNDFIIIDGHSNSFAVNLGRESIQWLCDRRFGIGSDGLMIITDSDISDFKMLYYNSDGNPSSMCGNGGRCIVYLAQKLGFFTGQSTIFEAIDGKHNAKVVADNIVTLQMNEVDEIISYKDAYIIDTGSPHYITFLEDISDVDVIERGRKVRNSDYFKEDGINVNFVQLIDDTIYIRTYERGVEDETLACGTGVTAAAIICGHLNDQDKNYNYNVVAKGGELSVSYSKNGDLFSDIWLTGPAVQVYEGVININ